MTSMDHQGFEQADLPERYVTDRLGFDERAAFEAHLVDCPVCLDRVEAVEGLASGFRALPGVEPIPVPAVARRARPRWALRSRWAIAAAAAVGVALLWGFQQRRQLERELAEERNTRSTLERQLLAARAEAEGARTPPPAPTPQPRRPVQVPVLTLLATRGADAPTLRLPDSPQPVVLAVERETPPRYQRYRVALRERAGDTVLDERLPPSSREAVVLAVDSGLLRPGEYQLVLEGEGAGGRLAPVSRHRFVVLR
jgi:hypothetical protein